MVGDHQLGAGGDGAFQELQIRADTGRHLADLRGARDLKTVRAIVLERSGVEQLVAEGDDLVPGGHRRQTSPIYHPGMSPDPAADPFIQSLKETDLYSIGAYFCDQHPGLVDEVVERSEAIESRGLESWASQTETPLEEGFRTLLTGLAVRYYKAVAG
jgi:hypothetical protein